MSGRVLHLNSLQAWESLSLENEAQLVDVRTSAEWNFVGVPDLSSIGKEAKYISWVNYPEMDFNTNFHDELDRSIGSKDAKLYFICRSGGRSLHAAESAVNKGYSKCINIEDGFEGEMNPSTMHRNEMNGWKYNNLPWRQS
ncbi:MAG: rhodanese-like domain-containing protein [Rickettsiales bacterium]